MRYEHLTIHNLGPFKDVAVDLARIEGTLVAVTGPNGAGKSTLLELLTGGACYRQCRTRGALAGLATDRRAYVEAKVVNGAPWTIRQTVDGVSGKGESLVLDAEGRPAFDSGKVRDFDAWAKATLTPPEVLYSSGISVQGDRGFLDLGRADRMAVLLRVLGIEYLEKLAKDARDRATAAAGEVEALRRRLEDLRHGATSVEEAQAELLGARAKLAAEEQRAAQAAEALRRAEIVAKDGQAAAEIRSRRAAVVTRLERAQAQLADTRERIDNNRKLLEDGPSIEEATRRNVELTQEREQWADKHLKTQEDGAAAAAKHQSLSADLAAAEREFASAVAAQERAKLRLVDREAVEEAAANLMRLGGEVFEADRTQHQAEEVLQALQQLRLTHKDDRIHDLREGLATIALGDGEPHVVADATLLADDERVAEHERMPETIRDAEATLQDATKALGDARKALQQAERLASRAGDVTAAADDLERAQDAAKLAQGRVDELTPMLTEWRQQITKHAQARQEAFAKLQALDAERELLAPKLRMVEKLAAASTRIETLEQQAENESAAVESLTSELGELPALAVADAPDLVGLRATADGAQEVVRRAQMSVGQAEARLEAAQKTGARIGTAMRDLEEAELRHADWKLLGQDLGRDGLQALEVDAAIPRLNAIVNELLTECHGPRFTVEIRTDRLTADGKQQREALDANIIDNEKGRDALAETFSGGELVIVGEAIALGLTVLGCERAGTERPTLVRDETGAALDPDNRPAYLRMLRHAARVVNADKVLFVSHSADMVDEADARIVIDKDGNVEVA